MFGTASLGTHQPSKTSLKTYGSHGERTTGGASWLLHWDRLESERKVRIAQLEQALRAEREEQSGAALYDDADAELQAQLYSDPESDCGETALEESGKDLTNPFLSAQPATGNDSKPGATRDATVTNRCSGPVGTVSQSSLGNFSGDIEQPSSISGKEPPRTQDSTSISKLQSLSSSSARPETTTTLRSSRKVMFQEKSLFQEDEDEQVNDGDEVLFRTPSFQILQKLKELPKPRPIERRVNPFGFDISSGEGSTKGNEVTEEKVSSSSSVDVSSQSTTRNSFLESPTTKRSFDILNKRAQQLVDLQRHRQPKPAPEPAVSIDDTRVENEPDRRKIAHNDPERDKASNSSQDVASTEYGGVSRIQSTTHLLQESLESTLEPEVGRHQVVQDDCVDLALGKRLSNIQITPQRLLAKQRKTYSHDMLSPSEPSAPSLKAFVNEDTAAEDPPLEPMDLFLDRDDVPVEEHDDFDELFKRARQNRQRPPMSSSPPRDRPASSPSASPRKQPVGSALQAPIRHRISKFERNAPSSKSQQQQDQQDPMLGTYWGNSLKTLHNPFIDTSVYTTQQDIRQITSSHIPALESPSPRLVLQHRPHHHHHQQQQQQQQQRHQPSPLTQPLIISQEPCQQLQREESTTQQRPIRQIRSLRRPPAVLVSSRKSVFRPTVDDLLAISDQRFFAQFLHLQNSNTTSADHVHDRHSQGLEYDQRNNKEDRSSILDFETLLPDCMRDTLAKIGEASYSEVYTVDLPVTRNCRGQRRRGRRPSKSHGGDYYNNELELFQSSRLNAYVKESTENNLITSSSRDKEDDSGDIAIKLVMKVMPFTCEGDTTDDNGNAASGRKRRTNGRRKSESSLLALEDIYREAMVSTQIMQGWKGFIGGFGALVMRGKYPKVFLSAWDHFCEENGTESERPDMYSNDQLYCIILLPYGGIDLEHCPLANWKQAWSILAQVASSLELKEQAPFWFEHRDLHWGNILVKGTRQDHILFPRRDHPTLSPRVVTAEDQKEDHDSELFRKIPTRGIIVHMIDFTLARVQGDKGNLIYMDLEKDQDLFKGQGDYQFDIYRMMRKQINRDWAASCPRTNLFWLHYIADKLLKEKNLKKPTKRLQTSNTKDDTMECWCYERVLAVSRMGLDRLDPSGKTPSATVLDVMLHNQPS
ncbi:Serine/threonine-protein kinase haspin [Modicella reniformis]|uniref:non-specific serine/threonine protein kinase n=1 Tax=Modicella reniformis TaxID=1440133 RepID=A0A9P6SP54_9FUNG|nr:Serine/threonine-protein kinase haspin [Modicella reniformis]